jgi:hypothetical protein
MVRNLSEQRERLAAARRAALARQAGSIVDQMMTIYEEGSKAARNLGETLKTGPGT